MRARTLQRLLILLHSILTLGLSRRWNPLPIFRRTRLRVSVWRAFLYWVVTLERMCVSIADRSCVNPHDASRLYMLAAMSLNLWILIVIVRQTVAYSGSP